LTLWEATAPDPNRIPHLQSVLFVTDCLTGLQPRVIWFACVKKPNDYFNWERWTWDIVFHEGRERVYVVRSSTRWEREKATVKVSLFDANPHQTVHEDSFRGNVRDYLQAEKPTEFEPLAQTVRYLLPSHKDSYSGDTPGVCTSVRAVCDRDDILIYLTCSKQDRPLVLRFNITTKQWLDELPPPAAERVYEYRAGTLVPGVLNSEGIFAPLGWGEIISFKDYKNRKGSQDTPRIYNLPAKLVQDDGNPKGR
jgi:hypothetical protein